MCIIIFIQSLVVQAYILFKNESQKFYTYQVSPLTVEFSDLGVRLTIRIRY